MKESELKTIAKTETIISIRLEPCMLDDAAEIDASCWYKMRITPEGVGEAIVLTYESNTRLFKNLNTAMNYIKRFNFKNLSHVTVLTQQVSDDNQNIQSK